MIIHFTKRIQITQTISKVRHLDKIEHHNVIFG